MTTLDKDKLGATIEALTLAKNLGFESLSSPVDILLEAAVDVCLLIEKAFREGSSNRRENPSIKELDVSDELGNAKMIKLQRRAKFIFDPRVAGIIKQFTAFFVLLKKSSDEALSFMESIFRTRFLASEVIPSEIDKKIQRAEKAFKNESKSAYYRRLRKNRTKIKTQN